MGGGRKHTSVPLHFDGRGDAKSIPFSPRLPTPMFRPLHHGAVIRGLVLDKIELADHVSPLTSVKVNNSKGKPTMVTETKVAVKQQI